MMLGIISIQPDLRCKGLKKLVDGGEQDNNGY